MDSGNEKGPDSTKLSIADRLKQLTQSRQSWQERVSKDDQIEAKNLSIEGRTGRLNNRAQSVLLEREVSGRDAREGYESRTGRRTGKLVRRGSSYSKKERETKYRAQLPSAPIKLENRNSIRLPEVPWEKGHGSETGASVKKIMDDSIREAQQGAKAEMEIFDPSSSDGLNSFYQSVSLSNPKGDDRMQSDNDNASGAKSRLTVNLSDLPEATEAELEKLPQKGTTRVSRPSRPKQRPPSMATVAKSTTSSGTSAAKPKLLSAIQVEGLNPTQRHSMMEQEALRGLAAKENFSAIKLGKMEAKKKEHEHSHLNPFNNTPMLIMVKGRYHVQVRLVAPSVRSMNDSDCFVLVTKHDLMVWKGSLSNIVEQNKAMELGKLIHDRKDLGCVAELFDVVDVGKGAPDEAILKRKFLKILATANDNHFEDEDYMAPVSEYIEDEDVWFEDSITATNKVYEVDTTNNNADLIPLLDKSCCLLQHSLLQSDKSLLFDFGSEVYVWFGKNATSRDRAVAPLLMDQLVETGYDYRNQADIGGGNCDEFVLCPLYPLDDEASLSGESRPPWIICGKVTEKTETLLFSNKFTDWPEAGFLKEIRTAKNFTDAKFAKVSLNPIHDHDFRELLKPNDPLDKGFIVEAVNVGRGDYWKDPIELRAHKVITTGVKCWPVSESQLRPVLDESVDHVGLFRDDEIYIVRWSFYTEQTGIKTLRGVKQRDTLMKQAPKDEKVAYFFWQGSKASKLDLGHSAHKVIDLDLEGGKQIRVVQGEEPAAFLRLFNGELVVQSSAAILQKPPMRLLYVQGAFNEERHLVEVEHLPNYMLRPYLCYIAISTRSPQTCYVIKGPMCSDEDAKHAKVSAALLFSNKSGRAMFNSPSNQHVDINEISFEQVNRLLPSLAVKLPRTYLNVMPGAPKRLVLLTSVTKKAGNFDFREVHTPFHGTKTPCSLPFSQSQLYNQIQPAFLLYDCGTYIFLWQGPVTQNAASNTQEEDWLEQRRTKSLNSSPLHQVNKSRPDSPQHSGVGSVNRRFIAERKRALETARSYAAEKRVISECCVYVEAGKEPLPFTLLFPTWSSSENNTIKSTAIASEDVKMVSVEEKMSELASVCYSLDVLRKRPLPPDVDPLRIEDYVKDEDFENLFKMPRSKFESLPQWKKTETKKRVNLF